MFTRGKTLKVWCQRSSPKFYVRFSLLVLTVTLLINLKYNLLGKIKNIIFIIFVMKQSLFRAL